MFATGVPGTGFGVPNPAAPCFGVPGLVGDLPLTATGDSNGEGPVWKIHKTSSVTDPHGLSCEGRMTKVFNFSSCFHYHATFASLRYKINGLDWSVFSFWVCNKHIELSLFLFESNLTLCSPSYFLNLTGTICWTYSVQTKQITHSSGFYPHSTTCWNHNKARKTDQPFCGKCNL